MLPCVVGRHDKDGPMMRNVEHGASFDELFSVCLEIDLFSQFLEFAIFFMLFRAVSRFDGVWNNVE